jgi:hypothetical protein
LLGLGARGHQAAEQNTERRFLLRFQPGEPIDLDLRHAATALSAEVANASISGADWFAA